MSLGVNHSFDLTKTTKDISVLKQRCEPYDEAKNYCIIF